MNKTIKGDAIKGNGLGRKLGFPTLNLPYDGELEGVFVVKVLIDGEWRRAAANLGGRPTIGDLEKLCEVHVVDWEGVVEGEIEVEVLERIRGVQKFDGLKELMAQLVKDVEVARQYDL